MKEKLYTIPLNDALNAHDECPFCFIERKLEQDTIDFVIGSSSSYMESDIRAQTDEIGFCRMHMKKMFDYGNALGNSLILQTHYKKLRGEMSKKFAAYQPGKSSFLRKVTSKPEDTRSAIGEWTAEKDTSCYICRGLKDTFERYISTFFGMYAKDEGFRDKIKNSKGFCLHHFGILCDRAEHYLNDKQKAEFYPMVFALMEENMKRIQEDIDWLVDKYDYRNKDADWKNSKDALQRGMQKLRGGYPADPVYKMK